VKKVMAKVDDMKRVMGAGIYLLLERGEKLDKLVQQSHELEEDAQIFKKRAVVMKARQQRRYWVKSLLLFTIMAVIFGLVVYIVTIAICGEDLEVCRRIVSGTKDAVTTEGSGSDYGGR